jgi:hypothetical protein
MSRDKDPCVFWQMFGKGTRATIIGMAIGDGWPAASDTSLGKFHVVRP